jgi:HSP20 family protein
MANQPIKKWEPFKELVTLRDDMDRFFNSFFGRSLGDNYEGVWAPVVDIEEDKDTFIVKAELPGMKKEDIKISVRGNILSLVGERKYGSEEKNKTYHRIERAYGKFVRTITLPTEVESDKVKAAYQDGILTITLPKPETMKPKEVEIDIK